VEEIGYRFGEINGLNASVSSVPVLNGLQLKELYLHEVLAVLNEYGRQTVDHIVKERLMQSACKHAIKAGEPMTEIEMQALLADYVNGTVPLTCPHGRPVIIRITKTELEKMFRRIV
jgi:DNA mismatch repair protein MutL